MANSEDVLEAARNHARDFTKFDRAFQEYHLAEAHLIAALAAEVRELRRDRARLDWLADCGCVLMWQDRDQEYLVVDAATRAVVARAKTSREAIDAAMGGGEGE